MKRNLLIVAMLAILVPGALLAQDEISLEGLAETVSEMSADFGLFARELARVNSRVDAIEEQLAFYEKVQEQKKGSGDPCIVVASSGSMMSFGNQLRPETLDKHLNEYGTALEDVVVKYARFHPTDGILEVRYRPLMDFGSTLEIVERWQGCEFLGVEFERS